jgi:hypothetical protein
MAVFFFLGCGLLLVRSAKRANMWELIAGLLKLIALIIRAGQWAIERFGGDPVKLIERPRSTTRSLFQTYA